MDLRDSPEQARFRAEARRWLRESLPAGWGTPAFAKPRASRSASPSPAAGSARLYEGGYAGLDWPREYGGPQRDGAREPRSGGEEYARAEAPNLIQLSVGTSLVGPTLIAHGAGWQQRRFLEPILRGDELWCQGFSEPNAGSDLAALRTRGERRGDEIVVTGQKIWTSFAQHAEWCILVVRTDPEAPKHRGLTFLLVDMKSPGITLRPLREMTGEAWFNEVFFDGVRVPLRQRGRRARPRLGRRRDDALLERGTSAQHARLEVELAKLIAPGAAHALPGRPASQHPRIRRSPGGVRRGVAGPAHDGLAQRRARSRRPARPAPRARS